MKKYILPLLNILYPYFVVLLLVLIFGIGISDSFEPLLDKLEFNPYVFIIGILACFLIGMLMNIVYMCIAISTKQSAEEWLKRNMIIKCAQIPAYIFIFILGFLCLITIFTAGISVLLMVLDGLGVAMTGFLAIAGIVRGCSEGKIGKGAAVLCCIGSFMFCIDVVIAIVLYRKVKKQR